MSYETTTYKESPIESGIPGPRVMHMPAQAAAATVTLKSCDRNDGNSAKNLPPAGIELAPNNYQKGIVTRAGTIVRFDDEKPSVVVETPGGNSIAVDDDAGAITLSDQNGNTLVMNKDGVVLTSTKDMTLEATGNVVIKGQAVDVK